MKNPLKILIFIFAIILVFFVGALVLLHPWSPIWSLFPEKYTSNNIEDLKKKVPFYAGTPNDMPKEKWVKLAIVEGFSEVENVEYIYQPGRGDSSSYISANVELKEKVEPSALDLILEKDIKEKGYKFNKYVDAYTVNYYFCDGQDEFYLDYGTYSDDVFPTKVVRFSLLSDPCNI